MFAYTFAMPVCGSCGKPLMQVFAQTYNAAKSDGIVQVICTHRECGDYDKPMEFDLPRLPLRPSAHPEVLAEMAPPKLVIFN